MGRANACALCSPPGRPLSGPCQGPAVQNRGVPTGSAGAGAAVRPPVCRPVTVPLTLCALPVRQGL